LDTDSDSHTQRKEQKKIRYELKQFVWRSYFCLMGWNENYCVFIPIDAKEFPFQKVLEKYDTGIVKMGITKNTARKPSCFSGGSMSVI